MGADIAVAIVPTLRRLPLYGLSTNYFFGKDLLLLQVRNNLARLPQRIFKRSLDVIGEAHNWPGNIRELENCIKRAAIMAEGSQITREDVGLALPQQVDSQGSLDLRTIRDAAEKNAIVAAMGRVNGNMVKAAEVLGISRPTLYDLMHRLGLK